MKKVLCLSAVVSMFLVSCTKDALVGSGNIVTEVRTLESFDNVHISGNREVTVVKSNERKVELTGYANLISNFEEEVQNGNLSFEYPAFSRVRKDNIKLKIFTPEVSMISLNGNTRLTIQEGFAADRFDLHLNGNTYVEAGAGTVQLLRIDASGNPEVRMRSVVAKDVDLHLSGNPDVEIYAGEKLSVSASGKGKIKYWGSPASTEINLSGTVKVERQ